MAVLFFYCRPDTGYPATPEAVVRQYQAHLDRNEFAAAKRYATPAEQERLDDLAAIVAAELPDSALLHTSFLQIDCQISGETATCRCRMQDEYEAYSAEYRLQQLFGQWRVDLPEQEIIIDTETHH